jgi:hypothetical protein
VNDVVELDERHYRFGRGPVRLRVEHVGDSDGVVYPTAEWVTLIGREVDANGEVIKGRQLSAKVSAIRPAPVWARAPARPVDGTAVGVAQQSAWPAG